MKFHPEPFSTPFTTLDILTDGLFQSADSPRFLISQGLVPTRTHKIKTPLPIAHSFTLAPFSVRYPYQKPARDRSAKTMLVAVRTAS